MSFDTDSILGQFSGLSFPGLPGQLSPLETILVGVVFIGGVMFLFTILAKLSRPRSSRRQRIQDRLKGFRHHRMRTAAKKAYRLIEHSPESAPVVLQQLNPFAFEYLIVHAYKQAGHRVRKIRRLTGDGGIDGMVEIDGRWHVLQAKRYAGAIGTGMIQHFIDTTRRWKMPGVFITSSGFTKPARALGDKVARIKLVDGRSLVSHIQGIPK